MKYQKILSAAFFFSMFTLAISPIVSAATITGSIKYEGEVPKFKEIKMEADPICLSKHTSPIFPESLVLGDGNALANVFVYIKTGLAKKDYPAPKDPVIFTQEGCHYTPHVFGIMVGQELKILNPDGTLHNVHALSKVNPEFNQAMPQFKKDITKVFNKEESMFPFKCDVHPWMAAWCSVMSHPFFSVTGKDGKFTIAGLDPGTYEIEVWHEKLGTQTASITVGGDETKEQNFTFTKPAKSE